MNRLALIAIAVLIAVSLALSYLVYTGVGRIAELQQENKGLMEAANRAAERQKLDRRVLVARQAKIASQRAALAQAQEALSEALQRNKTWSDTDVPDDVQEALGGASGPVPDSL